MFFRFLLSILMAFNVRLISGRLICNHLRHNENQE